MSSEIEQRVACDKLLLVCVIFTESKVIFTNEDDLIHHAIDTKYEPITMLIKLRCN